MDSGKRASMREGPLAALFRRTDAERRETLVPSAAGEESPGGESEQLAIDADAGEQAGDESEPTTPAAETGDRRTDREGEGARADRVAPSSPSARLRQAFSSELSAELVEPPAPAPAQSHPAPSWESASSYGDTPERVPFSAETASQPLIRVVGVGGGGVNAVNRMVEAEIEGVEFLAVNTDTQSLHQSLAGITLHIGQEATGGLGSGALASVGHQAAMEDYDRVKALLRGSNMVFIAAGEGGGTGTGAAPVVARIAREVGALTVAIVTKPFGFEGSRRQEQAAQGIEALADEVDTLIVVPNDRLLSVLDKQTSMMEAFRIADDVLRQGVQGISDLVTLPGLINLDFADVCTIMRGAGSALLGIGMGVGENRALDAASQAVASPLLETSMDGARSILLSITGGRNLSLWEVNEAAKAISEAAHPDANIIFGAMVDEKLDDQVWVTVVATGYREQAPPRARTQLTEPAGELRIKRSSPAVAHSSVARRRYGGDSLAVHALDVPEFMP